MVNASLTQPSNRLRVLRAERRWNQWQAAAASGLGRDRFWRIENGITTPTAEERKRIASAFGVPVRKAFPAPAKPVAQAEVA